ncbi:hypothetical protein ACIRPS_17950 [Streptomyces griseoviridis]
MLVEVNVCDTCKRVGVPTKKYTITDDEGREADTDRCTEHAQPFEAVLATPEPAPAQPAPAAKAPAKRAPVKKTAAKKTTAKKTAAKKAPAKKTVPRAHSKTPEMTIEEIEAAKSAGRA